jgi:hypothetical protein
MQQSTSFLTLTSTIKKFDSRSTLEILANQQLANIPSKYLMVGIKKFDGFAMKKRSEKILNHCKSTT